jgi:hypothetical protein
MECHIALIDLFYNGHITMTERFQDNKEPASLVFGEALEFEPYKISSTQIVDTMNLIGKCVVSGGIRRTAELAIGDHDDEEFINLKQDREKLENHRWASNNSIFAEIGMDYTKYAALTAQNGEPGYLYLDTAQRHGRLIDPPNGKDERVMGWNPCIHAEAPILTSEGLQAAKDIRVGDNVWTGHRWSRVAKKWDSGVKETFQYKTAYGSFYGTSNHKVFSSGERVEVGSTDLVDVIQGCTDPLLLSTNDQDVADGIMMGIGFWRDDDALIDGMRSRADELHRQVLYKFTSKKKAPLLNHLIINTSFQELGPHTQRVIPNGYYKGTLNTMAGFLRGLFSSRGTVSKMYGTVSLKLYSSAMAQQVQIMLSALGIRSYLKEGTSYTNSVYRIVIPADLQRFSSVIGFADRDLQYKLNTLLKCDELQGIPSCKVIAAITQVIPLGKANVYDIMVEADEHSLWSAGLHVGNCTEIALESMELCVSGNTKIQTKQGPQPIKDLVGYKVDIWNGKAWSKVKPLKTSDNSEMLRVHFSDGSYLDCTKYHRFSARAKTRKHFTVKKAYELQPKDIMPSFNLGDRDTAQVAKPNAYEYGLFTGDGYFSDSRTMLYMQQDDIESANPDGTRYPPQHPDGYTKPMQRVNLNLCPVTCESLRDYDYGLPSTVFYWNKASILNYVAGWIDSDGHISNKDRKGFESYRIYGTEPKLRDAQLLLRRANINHTCLTLFAKAGEETNFGTRNHDLWYLSIHSHECHLIPTRIRKGKNFSTGMTVNNRYPDTVISNKRHQTVIRVEPIENQASYCFYEPQEGMGVFNNVLTYQCNVPETYPSRHESLEDYIKTLKCSYLYGKSATLMPSHNERTNAVQMRNRRIGLSQSGIIQNINRIGFREHMRWCDEGYKYITTLDEIYSEWLCIPRSIKRTSIKPSGSVSLLPGVTPGIHYPEAEYYIRNIRVNQMSPIVQACEDAGYRVEPDTYAPNTAVVSFPVKEKLFVKSKQDITLWEQMELGAQIQAYWADNGVSQTISVKEHEKTDIARALSYYETRIKGISFLPLKEHGYKQAPYIPITKEQYEEEIAKLKPLDLSGAKHEKTEKYCSSDTCELPYAAG